ncbi:MAG: TonB-dependent receptor [Bacteroidales bacterium]|nr:TonB-dependent receptor [Bacteroidales bacterium]
MKTLIIISFLTVCYSFSIYCQEIEISGKITDKKGKPIVFANVAIKGSFDGASTNENGAYSFRTEEKGKQTLSVSYIGYDSYEQDIFIKDNDLSVNVILKEASSEIDAVVITAGSFEASDEKRTVVLRSQDIGTTAGAMGDITGAIETLPGTQVVGNSSGLFVRGGSGNETKIIIDEMVVQNAFYSPVPDVKQRGRFDPFLFSGTVFSSGGYSALYGQALSSTLVLKSKGLADSTNTGAGLHFYGGNLFHTHRWEKTSVRLQACYYNQSLYHKLFPQLTDWEKSPESGGSELIFRHKTSETGILKLYTNFSSTDMAINFDNIEDISQKILFELQNDNLYINSSYKEYFKKEKWSLFLGTSYSKNKDEAFMDNINMSEDEQLSQGKIIITNKLNQNLTLKFGSEIQKLKVDGKKDEVSGQINESYFAGFCETDWFLTNKLVARLGIRFEYSDILNNHNLAPRTSIAYKTTENSQVSFAFGKFYQNPEYEFLYYAKSLNFENSTHYIANYQWMKNKRTFRIELFDKEYDNLIKNITNQDDKFNNSGTGYAKGIELFWRDKKSIKNADYWISYSFLDTKRKYRDYPIAASPSFTSKHTLSVVYKHWVSLINSMLSLSCSYSSGRPYYNPTRSQDEFLKDQTNDYFDLSLNISKMTTLLGRRTVIFTSFRNILGQKHIFGYKYLPNGTGRIPIYPSSIRSLFIGVFISTY